MHCRVLVSRLARLSRLGRLARLGRLGRLGLGGLGGGHLRHLRVDLRALVPRDLHGLQPRIGRFQELQIFRLMLSSSILRLGWRPSLLG